jgi:hypothetical protein
MLHLVAILDALVEHAVLVADAVAVTGQGKRRHGIEEAGREPAEAAVAQGRVGFKVVDPVEVELESGKRLAEFLVEAHVDQTVRKQTACQKLHRKVVDALGVGPVVAAHGLHPALNQSFAHYVGSSMEPVAVRGHDGVFAD